MPLRDHFNPPVSKITSWQAIHSTWPTIIVMDLARRLPRRYVAEPGIKRGGSVEIDVVTLELDDPEMRAWRESQENGGGVATAVWAPPKPTFTVDAGLASLDEYEIKIYDRDEARRLVAAVEIVSPGNKDRPEHRAAFVAKCAALLQNHVSVTIVDLVSTRHFSLYQELLHFIGATDPASDSSDLYAAACRDTKKNDDWLLESWLHPLVIGKPLPTLPLWLADNLAVPLELELTYEKTCSVLRIP